MSSSVTITAYIDHFIYRNADNGYGVADLVFIGSNSPEESKGFLFEEDRFTAVGTMRGLEEGDSIEATGTVVTHAVYGQQLKIESFRILTPTTAAETERYLASGQIKGIGEKLAHRIVQRFGEDTFRIMEEEPERLAELKGISERIAREIGEQMRAKREQRDTTLFLQQVGIGGAIAGRILKQYGNETIRILKENPYRLAEEIDGVGFRTADEIARRMGISVDAEYRVASGLTYALLEGAAEGHSYLPQELLYERTEELLGLPAGADNRQLLETQLGNLTVSRKIVVKRLADGTGAVYSARSYREEQGIAGMLKQLDFKEQGTPVRDTEIDAVERTLGIELDGKQREAVQKCLSRGVMILTGGPGTGKTTTMGAILQLLEDKRKSFVLAAPTGRAAKRMTEATGYEARTIHRLLEVSGSVTEGDNVQNRHTTRFNRDEDNPLEADAVIIDEMSMVDMHLFYSLLKACRRGMHLILIGDDAQLPSVGAGQVLRDLIESRAFTVVSLDRIFRQAAQSDIIMNAHRIHAGEPVVMDNKSRDFFFLARDNTEVIIRNLVTLIRDKLPSYVGADSGEIQVLVPMRRGPLGAETLNRALQEALNPPDRSKKELRQGDRIWRTGDKVMQMKNNYNAVWEIRGYHDIVIDHGEGIFNGDLGIIHKIDPMSQEITVRFDENRMVRVPFGEMDEMDLAYATTIHKSQGSEYPAVLLPILGGPRMLLNRNLLYTAVTRAKSCVVILGSRDTVFRMIDNVEEMRRYTGLIQRIHEIPDTDTNPS